MNKENLKQAVCEAIDRHGNEIIELGERILHHPETGFNETRTSALVAERMGALGLMPQTGLALTGVKGRIRGRAPGPRLALIGELDSLRTSDHPLADPHTGAAHSCVHNAQIAGMLGVAMIRFMGRASHAGGAPQLGINALSAAMLALNAIHAQRETFWDKDTIRIHPIITKGGDAVSVVPAEVTMETFVRGGSREAIIDANMKVDRCLKAGAMAMGAEVEIQTIPGYLPQHNDRRLGEMFGANVEALFGPGEFDIGGHRTGSTDMGDIAHMIPVIHPYVAAALGKTHGADFRINELSDPGQ